MKWTNALNFELLLRLYKEYKNLLLYHIQFSVIDYIKCCCLRLTSINTCFSADFFVSKAHNDEHIRKVIATKKIKILSPKVDYDFDCRMTIGSLVVLHHRSLFLEGPLTLI